MNKLDEYVRAKTDPVYFIENYIQPKSNNKIIFDDVKSLIVDTIYKNNIVLTKHNEYTYGEITDIKLGFILHQAIFNVNFSIGILAMSDIPAKYLLEQLKCMFDMLPDWLKPEVNKWNKHELNLSNGASIRAASVYSRVWMGLTVNLAVCFEFNLWGDARRFYNGIYPVIKNGRYAKMLITIQDEYMTEYFEELWNNEINSDVVLLDCR